MLLHFSQLKTFFIIALCLIAGVVAFPSFIGKESRAGLPAWMQDTTVNLGLDLQGGSHLLLQVDFEAYFKEQMTNLVDGVRKTLRKERIGYKNLKVAPGGRVHFTLPNPDGRDVEAILHELDETLDIDQTGDQVEVYYNDTAMKMRRQQLMEQSIEIVGRRVNETGTREPIIQRQGDERILLQVPGLQDPEQLKRLLGKTAKLAFHLLDETVSSQDLAIGIVAPGTRVVMSDTDVDSRGQPVRYAIQSAAILSGDMLVDAAPTFDSQNNDPVVSFKFNSVGAGIFGDVTSQNVGKPFAVVLDNRVITAPVIRSPILGGSGIISGNFTPASANDLALLLRAGALPAPLVIVEERTVGPSLGADSIAAGTYACALALALVMVFMILNYGLFGIFSCVALFINGVLLFAMMALFGATLTLPGIAGIVLTLGMAVDTNVLIFERIREELANGKTVISAIESGFKMAYGTIMDAHVTTFIAALLLYMFGTGSVKGFAVTLSLGILSSLFTAMMVTRLMIVTWLRKTKPKTVPI